MDPITQIGVGGIFAVMVIDKVFSYVRNGRGPLKDTLDLLNRNVERQTELLQSIASKVDRIDVKVDHLGD